jgi:hypothetical protein
MSLLIENVKFKNENLSLHKLVDFVKKLAKYQTTYLTFDIVIFQL